LWNKLFFFIIDTNFSVLEEFRILSLLHLKFFRLLLCQGMVRQETRRSMATEWLYRGFGGVGPL
jgi:hypothetical protein